MQKGRQGLQETEKEDDFDENTDFWTQQSRVMNEVMEIVTACTNKTCRSSGPKQSKQNFTRKGNKHKFLLAEELFAFDR